MIGVFDSGLGGLSVLAAIDRLLPKSDLLYFADTAHMPYGEKSDAFVRERVLSIGRFFAGQGCQQIVIACNTATAAALEALQEALPNIPIVGTEPGVKPAVAASKSARIAVLCTVSTARSKRLAGLIERHAKNVHVDVLPCPGWAPHVESLQLNDPEFDDSARKYLEPVLASGADQIVIGCTHYTFLVPILEPIVAGRAAFVDVADTVAQQCQRFASNNEGEQGRITLLATATPERLQKALSVFGLTSIMARLSGPARLSEV